MKINLDSSKVIEEYKRLKEELLSNEYVLDLVEKKHNLIKKLQELDNYSNQYKDMKLEYDEITKKLYSIDEYVRFKFLEREINLFVMECNKKLAQLFEL